MISFNISYVSKVNRIQRWQLKYCSPETSGKCTEKCLNEDLLRVSAGAFANIVSYKRKLFKTNFTY